MKKYLGIALLAASLSACNPEKIDISAQVEAENLDLYMKIGQFEGYIHPSKDNAGLPKHVKFEFRPGEAANLSVEYGDTTDVYTDFQTAVIDSQLVITPGVNGRINNLIRITPQGSNVLGWDKPGCESEMSKAQKYWNRIIRQIRKQQKDEYDQMDLFLRDANESYQI